MRKTILFLVIAIAVAALLVPVGAAQSSPTSVILISWDGVQREHLREMARAGQVPNLMALPVLVEVDVLGYKTDTKAGHAQMLTGYDPGDTGVFNNSRYQTIPMGYTVFERLEAGIPNIVTIFFSSKTKHLGGLPDNDPWANAKQVVDAYDVRAGSASIRGPKILKYLQAYHGRRYFAFFHLADPDNAGHQHGEGSAEYTQAIILCDDWLGKILAQLKELGDSPLIYVTSDHGFDDSSDAYPYTPTAPGEWHKMAPYVFLATNDLGVGRRGTQAEVAPTILYRFGLDLTAYTPRLQPPLVLPRPNW